MEVINPISLKKPIKKVTVKQDKIKVLEIGSYAGASAAAFAKYFKNASIFCLDINISNFIYSSKRIQVYGLDINNEKQLNKILKKISLETDSNFFDIIIDDGSHYLSDILFSLKFLFRYINRGGLYITVTTKILTIYLLIRF